jgi:hypothetical protein
MHQLLVYSDDDNLLECGANIIKENSKTLLEASMNISLEINAEEIKYLIMIRGMLALFQSEILVFMSYKKTLRLKYKKRKFCQLCSMCAKRGLSLRGRT